MFCTCVILLNETTTLCRNWFLMSKLLETRREYSVVVVRSFVSSPALLNQHFVMSLLPRDKCFFFFHTMAILCFSEHSHKGEN